MKQAVLFDKMVSNNTAVKDFLAALDYDVVLFSDLHSCSDFIVKNLPDAVVLYVDQRDGAELHRSILESPDLKRISLMLCTLYSDHVSIRFNDGPVIKVDIEASQETNGLNEESLQLGDKSHRIIEERSVKQDERTHSLAPFRDDFLWDQLGGIDTDCSVGYWIYGLSDDFFWGSEYCFHLLGKEKSNENLANLFFKYLVSSPSKRGISRLLLESMAKVSSFDFKFDFETIPGKKEPLFVRGRFFVSGDGSPIFAYGIVSQESTSTSANAGNRDLSFFSDYKRLDRDSFLHTINHEVFSSLNVIMGFSSLLSDNTLSREKAAEYGNMIYSAGKDLENNFTGMLNLSMIKAGNVKITPFRVELRYLLMEAVERGEERAVLHNKPDIRIEVDKSCMNDSHTVFVDGEKFLELIMYLIENAIKYKSNGVIRIGFYKARDESVNVFVRNAGSGLSPERVSNIESLFACKEEFNSNLTRGLGVGLCCAKELANLMDGDIGIRNLSSGEAEFYLSFPKECKCQQHA